MSYKEKPQIKLYKYENSAFVLQAIIDDYAECSFENNRYSAGQFSITINYNIPNALLFERGLWVQFGNDPYAFGEILNIADSIGEDGKGSQLRIITGYDARYIFKRRIIKNLNNVENWSMTAKGEICMRNLIKDQCGSGAEVKRQLPIANTIPDPAVAIGKSYSVSESFSNLYEVLVTIATQSEIGWRLNFNGSLSLEFYAGEDRHSTVRFDTDFESLANGEFKDSAEAFANTVYVGGKGTGSDRDIYEGESAIEGSSPAGLDRFEAWDNQSGMTTENEYEAEATSMLNQYGQTLQVSGQGLAKCPYEYGKEYNVGDIITIAFSGKSAIVQILSITEHWSFGAYDLQFTFGKPQPDLNKQLQLILKQIQKASNKTSSTDSVRWYTIPTDIEMPSSDVIYNTIGFIGNCASGGSTFKLYLDDEKTGAKIYHVYFKQLGGGKLTLTTGKAGATNLVMNSGTYVAIIYVDAFGNVSMAGATTTSIIEAGNNQPANSDAVYRAIQESGGGSDNTPLGTIVSYLGTENPANGEWLICDGSTFDASQYPSLATFLGGNVLPIYTDSHYDYSKAETTYIDTNPYTFTTTKSGLLVASLSGWDGINQHAYVEVTRNGNTVKFYSTEFNSNQTVISSITIPILIGDVINFKQRAAYTNCQYTIIPNRYCIIKAVSPTDQYTPPSTEMQQIEQYVDNGLQRNMSYSTTEQWTGGTWIDGKPIYRKVVKIYNQGSLVSGITHSSGNLYHGFPFLLTAELITNCWVINKRQDNYVDIYNAGASGIQPIVPKVGIDQVYLGIPNAYTFWAVFEYTKTTD